MAERLITAKDVATRDGFESLAKWYCWMAERCRAQGNFHIMWDGERVGGAPIAAYIDFGRWAIQCECGGKNYVDPDEPFVFCARCGNGNSGMARPVLFPSETKRRQIEQLLFERPVILHPMAKNAIEVARLAKPVFTHLPRSWHPSQSIEDLMEMNSILAGGS